MVGLSSSNNAGDVNASGSGEGIVEKEPPEGYSPPVEKRPPLEPKDSPIPPRDVNPMRALEGTGAAIVVVLDAGVTHDRANSQRCRPRVGCM
jgi:hypothetical protein